MSDENQHGEATEPAMERNRRGLFSRVSVVWAVPILALLISLGVAWRSYSDRGVIIEIAFPNAAGVRADETQLRYRDVVVGIVEAVRFTDDLGEVVVEVMVDQDLAPYIDAEARFWIVRPEVSAQGVSGLDTVLSGVYIMGSWDGTAGVEEREFEGLGSAPLVTNGEPGLTFELRASDVSGLAENAPILYRGITVGRVGNLRLAEDGVSVIADAFVREPEARLINTATRFWDISGFTFNLGAQGAQLNVNSLASLVSGGVEFGTTVSGGEDLAEDPVFRLYPDQEAARSSVFDANADGEPVNFTVIFDDSVPGLEVGADVEFGGIVVGRVSGLTGVLDEETFGDRGVRLLTTIELRPGKMGLDPDATQEEVLDFMQFAVQNGLRAQLQSASLLGGLQIALAQMDDVPDAEIDLSTEPYPQIPSIEADLTDFADTAEGVFNRVNNLPIEELLDNAILVMQSVNRVLNTEGIQETPDEVLALLGDVRAFVNSEGIQSIPGQTGETLASFNQTAAQLEDLVTRLNEAGAVTALVDALEAAEEAADSVYETMEDGPETLEQVNAAVAELEALIAEVNTLPLSEVVAEVEGTLEALRTFLASDATQGLTGDVSALLAEVEGLVAEVRQSGLVETANQTLATLESTVVNLEEEALPILAEARRAIASAQGSISALPTLLGNVDALVASLNDVAQDVSALDLDQTLGNVDSILTSVNALVTSDAVTDLPADVQGAVSDLRTVLTSLAGEGGTIPRVNGLIDEGTATVADVNAAVDTVVADLQPVLTELQATLAAAQEPIEELPGVLASIDDLVVSLDAVAEDIGALPLDQAVANVNDLVVSLDTLISSEAVAALPADVQATLTDLRRVFAALTAEDGVLENANDVLVSADGAVSDIRGALEPLLLDVQRAAAAVADAADVAPEVAARAKRVADQIELLVNDVGNLPIEEIGERASSVLASADELISSPETQRVPTALADTLEEAQRLLVEIQEGGIIENANATLVSVQEAADRLPTLLDEVGGLLNQTGTVVEGYNARGALGAEVQSTLRDIQSAASAIDSLAREIERNPNSLLFGR
ncbi:Paraquat-inducible protein B [Palleronia marisminoris]|uniref:Paraquat-inducible protein B n=1 Tax=Palleronia marisminoris TaxID=315423 RepID=A0A1Y5RVZ5_9RHOB|nr:MlaD family protein [Palleronia marisminoris]SFG52924.1 Paraquat-inducible protein B [Palleronia marisminoris]SLN23833.1 Paraquat-inducible protein B [Palleronia marisminoris]